MPHLTFFFHLHIWPYYNFPLMSVKKVCARQACASIPLRSRLSAHAPHHRCRYYILFNISLIDKFTSQTVFSFILIKIFSVISVSLSGHKTLCTRCVVSVVNIGAFFWVQVQYRALYRYWYNFVCSKHSDIEKSASHVNFLVIV